MMRVHLFSILVSISFVCKSGDPKELPERVAKRDPFAWVLQEEKKVVQPVKKPVAKKPAPPKPPELPWHIQGVSLSSGGKYALFAYNNETKVVRAEQEVCSGWRVKTITSTSVGMQHATGVRKEILL